MQYYDFKDLKLSALRFGAMRLPAVDGDDTAVDETATFEMVEYAYEHGINYYDTAWGYHGGNSERVLGRALARYPRDSFYLADKFPGYDVSNFGKHEQIFAEQLERCGVNHFDFYLLHNVCELNIEQYLDDGKYGTVSFFAEQVRAGRIKHLGFSVHGNYETFMRFLEAYGDVIEFCQVQLNYMDWEFQNARAARWRSCAAAAWPSWSWNRCAAASSSQSTTRTCSRCRRCAQEPMPSSGPSRSCAACKAWARSSRACRTWTSSART